MSITLSTQDVAQIRSALQVMLSPLDSPSLDHWRGAVNRSLKELFQADKAAFFMEVDGVPTLHSDEYTPEVMQEYATYYLPRDPTHSVVAQARLRVANQEMAFEAGGGEGVYRRTEIYNDWFRPNQAEDGIGFTLFRDEILPARAGGDGVGVGGTHSMMVLHHHRHGTERFGEWGVVVMEILYPAFEAGVRSLVSLARHRTNLAEMLDRLGEGVSVWDMDGRLLYQTAALSRLLSEDREAAVLRDEMTLVARSLRMVVSVPAKSSNGEGGVLVREVRTATTRYRIQGCYAGSNLLGLERTIIVSLERLTPTSLPDEVLRERFRLTPAEIRVSRLLAEGKQNTEIAKALFISPHTAERHTERVLHKLGIRSRAEVAAILFGG